MATAFPHARPWPRVKWTRAGQLAPVLRDTVDLAGLEEAEPASVFRRLREADAHQAARFVAQCLPRMEAVRWMAGGLNAMQGVSAPARLAARKAVNRWLADPSDANRRLAFDAGEAAGFATPEGAGCLAVFYSGGSLAPPGQDQGVPPPPGVFGHALAGAVMMAALNEDPRGYAARLEAALDVAERIAAGDAA